jgi:preprotein translocase subunit SecE
MKKTEQKNKKKLRDKVSPSSGGQQSGSSETGTVNQDAKEERNRSSQAPSRREPERRRDEKSAAVKYVGIAGQFLKESRMELRKVKWPTRKELLASTAAVIILVLVISLYLGLIDFGLIKIIKSIVG